MSGLWRGDCLDSLGMLGDAMLVYVLGVLVETMEQRVWN